MKAEDQEDLTRVGPGTVMGSFMREYWIPAMASSELEADGPPVRLMLMGERLLAFRDSAGRVGVMDHRCPHRGASLFLGRNEKEGIRCIYHGWKFGADGSCLETPNLAGDTGFRHRVRARAYRVQERAGLVWVYMGRRAEPPAMPFIDAALLDDADVEVTLAQRDCNYLQALEGDIDTSHVGFLHFGSVDEDNIPEGHPLQHTTERTPKYHVRETDWGTSYCSYRPAQGGTMTYWRCANFMFPFWTQTPQGEFATNVNARAWVPMDDEHTMFIYLKWRKRPTYNVPLKDGKPVAGNTPNPEYLPRTTDWYGRWRLKGNASNDWLIDREAQRSNLIFSGIQNVHLQDQAVSESMGPIVDQQLEHLCDSDRMVVTTRRRLLKAAREFRDRGVAAALDAPEVYQGARSGYFLRDPSVEWLTAYTEAVEQAVRPVKVPVDAAPA